MSRLLQYNYYKIINRKFSKLINNNSNNVEALYYLYDLHVICAQLIKN